MDTKQNRSGLNRPREGRWVPWYLFFIFIALTIGIGTSGYFYYKTQEKELRDATNDQLNAVADLKVKQIVAWRDDQIENATIILKQSAFVPFVHQWLANPTDSILKEKVSAWMNIFLEDKNYKSIFLADAQGNARLSLPQRDQQLSNCIKPHFAEALRTKKIIFTDFHFVATTRQIHLALIIPLFDSNAAPFGFIVLEIAPYQFLYPLIQTWPTPSKTAETLLVRREGNEVVFLNELRHRKNTALMFRLPISRKNLPAVMAIEGKTGIVEGVDYRGKPVIATVRANSDSSWYLVAKIDVSEINASIEERTQFVAIIVALLIALSGTGFGLLWRHQRSQFYKKQYETERKLAIECKQAEEALRESERRLIEAQKMAHLGYWIWDVKTGNVEWSEEVYKIFHLDPKEFSPQIDAIQALSPWPEDHERDKELIRKAMETHEKGTFEQRFLRPDKSIGYYHSTFQGNYDDGGDLIFIVGTVQDITESKQAEEALKRSEERFKQVANNLCEWIWEVDSDGLYTYSSPALEKILGYKPEEVVGKMHFYDLFTPEKKEVLKKAAFEVFARKESFKGFVNPNLHKNGTLVILETSGAPVLDQQGRLLGYWGGDIDITERKRLEKNLKNEQQEIKLIIDFSPIILFYKDKEGKFIRVNKTFAEAIKLPEAEFVGKTVFDLYSAKIAQDMTNDDQEVLKSMRPKINIIEQYESANGIRWVQTDKIPICDKNGIPFGLIGFSQDITDRKRAGEALQRSEDEARRLAHENAIIAEIGRVISSTLTIKEVYSHFAEEVQKLIPFDRISINGINFQNQSTNIVYFAGHDIPDRRNGECYPFAGSLSGEVIGTRSSLLFQADDGKEWAERFPASLPLFRAGIRSKILLPIMSRDQVIAILHFESLTPKAYTDADVRVGERVANQIAGAIANAQLFAEHERAEIEKLSLQAQLQQSQKMEAIGQLAGGVAHDFNNLLTVISVQAQLGLRGLREGDPLKEKLKDIELAADRAANLTRQLLAFSRRQILEMKVINLNFILKDMEKMLRRVIGEDIELKALLADDLGLVKVDPGQMEQVIVNLAVNAKDAMPQGGKLLLETANAELDEEYVHSHVGMIPGAYVLLSITDTGVGMSKEVKEQIFDPFFTTKEKGKGTGLGLSTVYGIVKQSGGDIYVDSEEGKGTTFKVYLPRVFEPQEEIKKEAREELPRGTETIVVVEDARMVRRLAIDILRRQGYKVLEAEAGGEGLLICEQYQEPIDLILTDVVMPKMSGSQFIERLRQVRKDFKVLYMTGYTDEAIVQHGILEEGINLIHKPFTIEKLARKVREVLDG